MGVMSELARLEQETVATFSRHFGGKPQFLVRSPGRVNIIGEHTDYNDGFVLPMAIDRCLMMAFSPRNDRQVRVHSTDFDAEISFSLDGLEKNRLGWGDYITGCFWAIAAEGQIPGGLDMVICGNIPVGASLSSSAALELGILRAAAQRGNIDWRPMVMAELGQKVENQGVGMNCGIMDQAICAGGRKGHALLIDCRDLSTRLYPLPKNSSIVILDTSTRRGLVDSAYNERRRQCDEAAKAMHVNALRDADEELLNSHRDRLDPLVYLRARHIISENRRVQAAAVAMAGDEGEVLGSLMYASHCSLRDDFDVSGPALNAMVECAMAHPACLGARMTGAGFAGCAVALVKKGEEQHFVDEVGSAYATQTTQEPRLYVCQAADGTSIRQLDTDRRAG